MTFKELDAAFGYSRRLSILPVITPEKKKILEKLWEDQLTNEQNKKLEKKEKNDINF